AGMFPRMHEPKTSAEGGKREAEGPRPRAVLVGIQLPGCSDADLAASLTELGRLADTLGLEVIGQITQKRQSLAVGAGIGGGKLRELAAITGGTGVIPGYVPEGADQEEYDEVFDARAEEE